jgi:hypothetical protein
MSSALARKPARARRPKNPKAKGRGRKKASKPRSRAGEEEVLLEEEKYSYTGTFKPKRDES